MDKEKDVLAVNTLKVNGIAAVNKANSGHPGIVLSAAPMMHTLFSRHMIYDVTNLNFVNRDRLVLSAGHGSALLYSQLRILGVLSEEDLKNFRQIGSKTPGHPEYGLVPGVECTTGPLGQGIAMAVGFALGQTILNAKFPEVTNYTYVICGDGDLQEGVGYEAMSFAGHNKLAKLIVLHDSNKIQLDGPVAEVFSENLQKRVEAMGWDYFLVENNDVESIDKALVQAKQTSKPSFIEIKTTIGQDATLEGTSKVHGAPLGEDIETVKQKLNWTHDEFYVPQEVTNRYKETLTKRTSAIVKQTHLSEELKSFLRRDTKIEINIEDQIIKNVATRASSGEVIQHLNKSLPNWVGGSADLVSSTKAAGPNGVFSSNNPQGGNILYGVREFAMASIANGLALYSNFKPFVSTFFVFADYLKPALRLSALMKLPVTYVFTHDSIFVGEDGPTHEPVEQTAMVRSVPNVNFFRPADEKEVVGAYETAVNSRSTPTVIALTRQNVRSLEATSKSKVQKGSYYVYQNPNSKWTLVSSGSELASAYNVGKKLNLSVVSLGNSRLAEVFWNRERAISIEAATTFGLAKYAKFNIGIDTFGESGPGDKVNQHFGLDFDSLVAKVSQIIR